MSNTTVPVYGGGPNIIQADDFFQSASILHPLVIGTIIIALLFAWLRVSSNRSVAPMTLFDKIVSVAMGSTLAGVVNGTALVRGIIALAVLLFWQYATSYVAMRWPGAAARMLTSRALIIAYDGRALHKVMRKHRIADRDLNSALRVKSVWHIKEVELVTIEPNGTFSVYLKKDYPKDYEPQVLLELDGYRALREHRKDDGEDDDDVVTEVC